MGQVLTGPLAILSQNGVALAKCRNVTVTENQNRVPVIGLGFLTPDEVAVLGWSGVLNIGFFAIQWGVTGLKDAVNRNTNSIQEFVNTVLLQENGLSLTFIRKVADTIDPVTKIITPKYQELMTVSGMFNTTETMEITEGQVSGHNQSFMYTNPVLITQ